MVFNITSIDQILMTVTQAEDNTLILGGVLLSLVIIYSASKIGGEICARLSLPPVLGELVGGVIVGASILHLLVFPDTVSNPNDSVLMQLFKLTSKVTPDRISYIFSEESEVISVLSEIGVVILLFEIGLESDLKSLIKVGPYAALVAVVGVAVPFTAGTAGLMYIFHLNAIPAIFAGAALTATSIGITAKVLSEIGRLTTPEGQIIIGAAVLDDILGIIILAVVASLSKTGEVQINNVIYLIVISTVFLVGIVFVGRFLIPYFERLVDLLQTRGQLLLVSLIIAFFLSYVAAAIQLEAILGSFVAGLVLAETEKQDELILYTRPVADILTPIFFVCVGARTNLGVLNPAIPSNREGLIIAIFLIGVAIVGKISAGFVVPAKLNRLAIGVGMIPRGEVGLIFAAVGSASGALSEATNTAIIMMVIITTFLAPPLLRVVFKSEPPELVLQNSNNITSEK